MKFPCLVLSICLSPAARVAMESAKWKGVCLSACLAVCLSACTFPPSLSRCPGNCQVLDCATPDTMFEELLGCRDQTSLINFSFFSAPDPKLSLKN